MSALIAALVPLIILVVILVVVALIIWWVAETFSPHPLVTKIVQAVVFAAVLIVLLTKFIPMLGLH